MRFTNSWEQSTIPNRNRPASRHASKTKQQLIDELALLEESLDAMPDAVSAFDADDRLVFFNAAYRDLYSSVSQIWVPGISYRDMVRILLEHASPDDVGGREEEWIEERTVRHKRRAPPQDRYYESGRIVRISHHPTASDGSIDIRIDVAELRQSQRDERRLQNRLVALLAALPMPVPMFLKAPDGRFLGCNQAFQCFLGESSSDIIGHRVTDLADYKLALWHDQNDTALFVAGGSDVFERSAWSTDLKLVS